MLEVRTGTAVGTNAGPGAADTCGWSVIGGWNGIAWRRGAAYCELGEFEKARGVLVAGVSASTDASLSGELRDVTARCGFT